MNKFTCCYCQSNRLEYSTWVDCIFPVNFQDGNLHYGPSVTNDSVSLDNLGLYRCGNCQRCLSMDGDTVRTEQELDYYCQQSPVEILQREQDFYVLHLSDEE